MFWNDCLSCCRRYLLAVLNKPAPFCTDVELDALSFSTHIPDSRRECFAVTRGLVTCSMDVLTARLVSEDNDLTLPSS